jgi:protein RecA
MSSAADLADALKGIIGVNDDESTVKQFLDTGFPPLNNALSARWDGGLAVGRIAEISGPPSAGKTAIATAAMANAQKSGGVAGFMDHERSFALTLAPKLGLDTTPGRFIFKKPQTFEESITLCVRAGSHIREKKLIPAEAPICWVFDSLAAMVPQAVMFDQKTGKTRAADDRNMKDNLGLALATSAHLPALAQWAEQLDMCIIFLNQLRQKPGVAYGDPTYTPGGTSKEFYYSQRLQLSASKITKAGEEAPIGMEVTGKVIKNKVSRPFLKASWRFMFMPDGSGRFDVERSLIEFLEEQKLLKTPRPGFVEWDGKQIGKEALAREIEKKGAMDELKALLPPNWAAPVVASAELESV